LALLEIEPIANGDNDVQEARVLSRLGARELTVEETLLVAGSIEVFTRVCTAMHTTAARPGDGDACNSDHDQL
jgi:hypothetical protein